jgi:hypothetical protein
MDKFGAHIDLTLHSQYTETVPTVTVKFANAVIWHGGIDKTTVLSFDTEELLPGNYWLSVVFGNKDDSEQQRFGKDMMVGVESLRIQNYDHEFSIYSEYEPDYPEPWHTQQKQAGTAPPPVTHSNYLGWPGEWRIQISLPVYRWIHVMTSQGWLI